MVSRRNPTGIFNHWAPIGSSRSQPCSGNGGAAPGHVATAPLPTARGPSAGYLQPALASQWELERTYQPFVLDTLFGPMLPALSLLEMPPEYRIDFPLPSHPLSYLSVLSPVWYWAQGQLTHTQTQLKKFQQALNLVARAMTGSFEGTLCTLCLCDLCEMLIFLGTTFKAQHTPHTY